MKSGNGGQPVLIVECKSPSIKVDQRTFEQAARYNKTLQVRYLMVTNGLKHYCCAVDHERGSVDFLPRLPTYSTLTQASTP